MMVCVPCAYPGGPDAAIVDSLEESEMLDFYDLLPDGRFEHVAQTRKCLGGCTDPVESIVRRGAEAIVVTRLSPNSLLRLRGSGVRVMLTDHPSVRAALEELSAGKLEEIGLERFAQMARKRMERDS